MAGDGGGTDIKPVGGLGGKFVGVRGFDSVDPACFLWVKICQISVGQISLIASHKVEWSAKTLWSLVCLWIDVGGR